MMGDRRRDTAARGAAGLLFASLTLGAAPAFADVTHLIWPESAFPFYLLREPDALAQVALIA